MTTAMNICTASAACSHAAACSSAAVRKACTKQAAPAVTWPLPSTSDTKALRSPTTTT
jgi:hypothetical protein